MLRIFLALLRAVQISLASPLRSALYIAALEQQLAVYKAARVKPRLSVWDRLFWVLLSRWFHGWTRALVVVQPATVIDWHRKGFRFLWRWRSRPGRPPLDKKLIQLIVRIARHNPSWGAARIQGELLKLGFAVSMETVRKYALPTSGPRAPRRLPSQPWRAFLNNHGRVIVACDFVTQHLAGFQTAYVFVVLHIESRKILWTNVTRNPSLDWVKLQLREVFAFEHGFKFLIHDNDGIFGQFGPARRKLFGFRCHLDQWLPSLGVRGIPTPYHAPNANAFVERFNRSLRREALDHFIFLGEDHLRRVVRDYVDYYNHSRPSQGTGKIPEPRAGPLPPITPDSPDNVVALPVLGGIHHDYRRVA